MQAGRAVMLCVLWEAFCVVCQKKVEQGSDKNRLTSCLLSIHSEVCSVGLKPTPMSVFSVRVRSYSQYIIPRSDFFVINFVFMRVRVCACVFVLWCSCGGQRTVL